MNSCVSREGCTATPISVGLRLSGSSQAAVMRFGWSRYMVEISATGPGASIRSASRCSNSFLSATMRSRIVPCDCFPIDVECLRGGLPPRELSGARQPPLPQVVRHCRIDEDELHRRRERLVVDFDKEAALANHLGKA